jgi:DNA-binding transcriptional regulator LsrR (DeoR family)
MAVELSNSQKKDYAKALFLHESLTRDEIAEKANVSRRTVGRWIETEKWKELKVSITITREEQVKNLYNQLKAVNDTISGRKEQRYATTAEADTISKLATAIEKMESETGIAGIVGASRGLLDFVRRMDTDKARELSYFFDAYIKSKL